MIAAQLTARLVPLVAKERLRAVGEDPEKAKLDVIVGLVSAGAANLFRLRFQTGVAPKPEIEPGFFSAPASLRRFYSNGLYANDAYFYGDHLSLAEDIGLHLRTTLRAGIAEEARLNDGKNTEVGGEIDVVVVRETGAEFVKVVEVRGGKSGKRALK